MELTRRAERFFAILGCLVAALIAVAILVEVASSVALSAYYRLHRDPLSPQQSPAYDNESWGRDFWLEQSSFWATARAGYLPFTVWGVRKWHGKYINTDDSEMGSWRRTIPSMNDSCGKTAVRRIWVFGGSTVYGIGTPDSATIPSYLSRELNANPASCVEVTNLGAEGFVTNQELILLMQQLKAGRRPDIAIFYDGINESLVGGFSPGVPTEHWNFDLVKEKFEALPAGRRTCLNALNFSRLMRALMENNSAATSPNISDAELAARAEATLQNYEENLKLIDLLAQTFGFKAYFFWQPTLAFGDKMLAPFEKKLKDARKEEVRGQVTRALKAVYEQAEIRSSASGRFIFLGHALDNAPELMYVDEFHLDPRGNELMAHAIATTIGFSATSH